MTLESGPRLAVDSVVTLERVDLDWQGSGFCLVGARKQTCTHSGVPHKGVPCKTMLIGVLTDASTDDTASLQKRSFTTSLKLVNLPYGLDEQLNDT